MSRSGRGAPSSGSQLGRPTLLAAEPRGQDPKLSMKQEDGTATGGASQGRQTSGPSEKSCFPP